MIPPLATTLLAFSLTDWIGTVVVVGGVIGFIAHAWYTLRNLSGFEEDVSGAEHEFERRAVQDLGVVPPTTGEGRPGTPAPLSGSPPVYTMAPTAAAPPPPVYTTATQGAAPPLPARHSNPAVELAPLGPPGGSQDAESVEDLALRLQKLGVIGDREGTVKLATEPPALIHRLRRGGLCLLMPRMEGEETMLHMARRFDMLFVLCRKGEVLVVDRYQTRLPSLLNSPGDMPRA